MYSEEETHYSQFHTELISLNIFFNLSIFILIYLLFQFLLCMWQKNIYIKNSEKIRILNATMYLVLSGAPSQSLKAILRNLFFFNNSAMTGHQK